jgi:GAF domain-containing protein
MTQPSRTTDPRLRGAPQDDDIPMRMQRLEELGLGCHPVTEFDKFAENLARATGAPYAMVNFVRADQQFFAGLHAPSRAEIEALDATRGISQASVERAMGRDQGYCPHVAALKLARVFDDVCEYPRWGGNRVVNELGIRSYIGAPLIDRKTGVALGTVCAVNTQPSEWGREGLELIKAKAQEALQLIRKIDPSV